jgi:hypothetical protein
MRWNSARQLCGKTSCQLLVGSCWPCITAKNVETVKCAEQYRGPTPDEEALIRRLLEADFPGRNDLTFLLRDFDVRTLDEDGGLELRSRVAGYAAVVKRVPVEAEAKDEDGTTIHLLLHVVDGRPTELEIFKEDNSLVKRMPLAAAFELMVLPPAPND